MKTTRWTPLLPTGLLVAGALAGSLACQGGETTQQEPSTQTVQTPDIFFAETAHDFGTVKQGDTLEHVFKLENRGKAPLKLSNPSGS